MAKGDQEQANKDIQAGRKEQSGNYYDYLNAVKKQGEGLGDQAKNERGQLWQTGTDYAATGGLTPEMMARLRATSQGGGGGGGGSSAGGSGNMQAGNYGNGPGSAFNYVGPSAFNNVNFSFDDARKMFGESAAAFRPMTNERGGLSDEQMGNINRGTLLDFEKTGGYSDPQLADIRARSNSTVPAFYGAMQDAQNRQKVTSGQGFGGAFDASSARMARQGAQDSAEQTRNTEIGLGDTVRQGRFQASSKLADLGMQTADLASRNRLSAASGLSGVGGGLAQIDLSDAQMQMLKAKGIDDYTINVATGKDRYATAEDQIAAQERIAMAGIGASSGAANAALQAANERFLIGSQQQGQQFGMGNLADLYRSANGPLGQNNASWLAGLQGMSGSQNDLLRTQAGLVNSPGSSQQGWNNFFGGMGSLAGGLGGLGGGNWWQSLLGGGGKGNQFQGLDQYYESGGSTPYPGQQRQNAPWWSGLFPPSGDSNRE